ncbi:MAG: DUF11 domain-containing protein [Anaerolineae bacterium]|nr:DUF11 domain-containing protein [Anaerolineae bacterium]
MNSTEQITRPRGALPRPLLLAIPLALLGVLLVTATVQAVMVSRVHTTLAQFDTGSFDRTGLLDIPSEGIHSVQLLPIGLTGDWAALPPLPRALADMAAVTNGDFVYVIGGIDAEQNGRAEVYRNTLNLSGTIGAWVEETALPVELDSATAAVYRGAGGTATLYVIGGVLSSGASTDTVYRAPINNTTGAVGAWTLEANLPVVLHYASAVVHGETLYVIGGYSAPNPLSTVYYAPINADGSLGAFSTTESLPKGLFDGHTVVYEGADQDTVYHIGGRNRTTSTFEVFFADFAANGTLTPWQISQGNLPLHVYAHNGVLINGSEILLTGGVANALYPSQGISSTVKAALVDPGNPSFRLYDWCLGVPPPTCTIGAWQTGGILPEVRAFHETVDAHGWLYVLGGKDVDVVTRDTVYAVSVHGVGNLYSPEGSYLSEEMNLSNFPAILHQVTWDTTYGHPGNMSIAMEFRYSANGADWSDWTAPVQSVNGANTYPFSPMPDNVRYFQYRASFETSVSNASPLLDEVEVFYELDDPDLQVRKDAGEVESVNPGDPLLYYVYYTNTGEYLAPHTTITEVLPEHTTYAGVDWQRVGTTRFYTYSLGSVQGGESGVVEFEVDVNTAIPAGVEEIVNQVEIDFRPFVDRAGATISDPVPADNEYIFPLPLKMVDLLVDKVADPAAGSNVDPGQHITYTVVYTNIGSRDLTQALITDNYDPTGSYQVLHTDPPPAEPGGNVWEVPSLPMGASGEIQIVVAITTTTLPNHWVISNEAYVDTAEGNPVSSPVVTHTVMQPPAPRVDLVVDDLTWQPERVVPGTPVTFRAVIVNQGDLDANPEGDDAKIFWAELYVKPQSSEPPTGPSDHDYGFHLNGACCRFDHAKNINSLAAGASTVVYFPNLLTGDSVLPPGVYDVYVQIDTAYGFPGENPYWGMYAEEYEANNLWHTTIVIESGGVYLPMVYKRYW